MVWTCGVQPGLNEAQGRKEGGREKKKEGERERVEGERKEGAREERKTSSDMMSLPVFYNKNMALESFHCDKQDCFAVPHFSSPHALPECLCITIRPWT